MVDTALVDRLAAAYNTADADGFAALFSRDAQFVNIYGMRMSGRSGIAAGHRAAFATRLVGTLMTVVDVSSTPVDAHTAVLHVVWFLTHSAAATVATLPECHGVLTLVATTHQGWTCLPSGPMSGACRQDCEITGMKLWWGLGPARLAGSRRGVVVGRLGSGPSNELHGAA